MSKKVIVVGGGLAGMAAALYLARGGRSVTVFEKRRALGGRAVTHLRHGYRFNIGAHAFYRAGAGAQVCRELGVPIKGGIAKPKAIALIGGEERRLPTGFWSLLTTSLLSLRGKRELTMTLASLRWRDGAKVGDMTVREWLDQKFSDARARDVMQALLRLSTYCDHDTADAALTLAQMRIALRGGTLYVDEGWQRIVDSLRNAAVSAGVNFVSSARIVGVVHDSKVRAVELGGLEFDADRMDTMTLALPETNPEEVEGALVPADTVLLAVDPTTAYELAGDVGRHWTGTPPITAACLDVGLRSLPDPKRTFALGIDEPLYYAVHSAFAQLAPKGGALVHLVKYRRESRATNQEIDGGTTQTNADEKELEALLDRMQPGWRDVLVHRRFLPAMTVSNALVTPANPRPSVKTAVDGLYLAGDWVGEEGLLSDASFASARAAARAILAT